VLAVLRWGFNDKTKDDSGVSGFFRGARAIASRKSLTKTEFAWKRAICLYLNFQLAQVIGFQIARLVRLVTILDLELSALESENKVKLFASPRITVANQHEAYIGGKVLKIPYVLKQTFHQWGKHRVSL